MHYFNYMQISTVFISFFFFSATMSKRFYCPLGKYTLPLHSANFKAGIFNLCCITHFFLLNVFKIFLSIILFLYGCFSQMYVHHLCAWELQKPEGGIGSSETGVSDSREFWELDSSPMQGQ